MSVAKSDLHENGFSITALSAIDTSYLVLYALGQFFSGWLGDRISARRVIALGLIGSALASMILGFTSSIIIFAVAFGLNGLFQSTGWSNNIKALEPALSSQERGKMLGLWGTNQQIGGLLATALASLLLAQWGITSVFLAPALITLLMGIMVFTFLREQPSTHHQGISSSKTRIDYAQMLKNPFLWALSFSYFGLKLIRYSLLFWLPFYLHNTLHLDKALSGYLSISFEVGGVIGSILIGSIADRYFPENRVRLIVGLIATLAFTLYAYRAYADHGLLANTLLLALVGFFMFGPDTLISGACAQDIGGSTMTGSVAGFINGIGSLGAVLQGALTAHISMTWGFSSLFYVFFIIACISSSLLLPFVVKPTARTA